ncbi:MAG TPA: transposase, partial [Pararhizobium sp.]|nr:transposase [Pararhizobium sp.]
MPAFPRSLIAFQGQFPDDAACAAWLAEKRWPEGFACPACGGRKAWPLKTKAATFECAGC